MGIQGRLDGLLVVIVLFKQKPEQSLAYKSVQALFPDISCGPQILIYDNSPERCEAALAATYIHNPANAGVSKAYNEAAAIAVNNKMGWMLLLDQDTSVTVDLFIEWARSSDRHADSVAFVPTMTDSQGTVSPFSFVRGAGRRLSVSTEKFWLSKYRFINTGLFIQTAAFIAAGGYDEQLPLDFSDISFGYRLMRVTDHFFVMDISLPHAFSGSSELSREEMVARFRYFCSGAFVMGKKYRAPYTYWLRAFMRALHLSLHYKTSSFIRIFFEYSKDG